MNMPGFTAEASFVRSRGAQKGTLEVGRMAVKAQRVILPQQFGSALNDPSDHGWDCGPCACHIRDVGLQRFFFCYRECKISANIPGNPYVFYYRRVPCPAPWQPWQP
jgi:hypothetical protein